MECNRSVRPEKLHCIWILRYTCTENILSGLDLCQYFKQCWALCLIPALVSPLFVLHPCSVVQQSLTNLIFPSMLQVWLHQ